MKKGKLSYEDLKESGFLCGRAKEFVKIVNGFLESLKYSKLVQKGSGSNESAFKTHIEILKDIVIDAAKMAENESRKDRGTSREIELELARFGYEVEKVEYFVYDNYFQVEIELKDGFKSPRKMEIEEIVKGVVGVDVEIISEVPKMSGGYSICAIKKPEVHVDYSIFTKSKENINGDRVCFLQLKNGKFLACISDGMGTGKTASENSFIVIDALKKFSSLGFDRRIAIKFINSLLSVKNGEEFASIDVVCIDRFSLMCEFLKAGAMPTFIKRKNEVLVVESSSLPVGIEAESQFDFSTLTLQRGDMIFMFSDGLFSILGEDAEKALKEFIAENEFVSTQSSAKQIFEWAVSNSFFIKDDVTIIVLRSAKVGLKKKVNRSRKPDLKYLDTFLMLVVFILLLVANIVAKPSSKSSSTAEQKRKLYPQQEIKAESSVQHKSKKNDIYINLLRKDKNTVERIPLEEYVIGVVAAEMPAEFNIEALKAQAVASRTYAARRIISKTLHKSNKAQKVYLCDDFSHCQAYIDKDQMKRKWGKSFEKYYNKIRTAVEQTKGQVLVYNSKLIDSLYHAASGGRTEDAKEVFGQPVPYLKSVVSRGEENCPKFSGEFYFTYSEFIKRLKSYFPALEVTNSRISTQIRVVERTNTGRVKFIKVGNSILSGNQFRNALDLYSTEFWVYPDKRGVRIYTKGYGHGLGMSQWGANYLALQGKNYQQILLYYYQNVKIGRLKYK